MPELIRVTKKLFVRLAKTARKERMTIPGLIQALLDRHDIGFEGTLALDGELNADLIRKESDEQVRNRTAIIAAQYQHRATREYNEGRIDEEEHFRRCSLVEARLMLSEAYQRIAEAEEPSKTNLETYQSLLRQFTALLAKRPTMATETDESSSDAELQASIETLLERIDARRRAGHAGGVQEYIQVRPAGVHQDS